MQVNRVGPVSPAQVGATILRWNWRLAFGVSWKRNICGKKLPRGSSGPCTRPRCPSGNPSRISSAWICPSGASPGGFAPVSNAGWSPLQSKPHSDEAGEQAQPTGFCLTSLPHKRLPDEQTLEGSARPPRACPGGRDPPATRPRDEPGRIRPAGWRCHQLGKPTAIYGRPCPRGLAPASIWHFAPSCRRSPEPGVRCVSGRSLHIPRNLPALRRKVACRPASLRQTGAHRFLAKRCTLGQHGCRAPAHPPAVPGPGVGGERHGYAQSEIKAVGSAGAPA